MRSNMMIDALRDQRATKMDPQAAPSPSRPGEQGGLAARVEALEKNYEEICRILGMEEKQESTGNPGDMNKPGNPGKMEKY